MKPKARISAMCAGVLVAAGTSLAAVPADPGKSEYNGNCAVCHGANGDGNGPYRPALVRPPADLRHLAKNNGGTYPFEHVYQVIDGRIRVEGHGSSEMPIWGDRYSAQAAEYYVDMPYQPERYVRARILAVAEYVYRLQVK